jgi:hypothetical protein
MSVEDRIRAKAHFKMRVWITRRKRCRQGFVVTLPDGFSSFHPNRREALQALLARLRCEPIRNFILKPAKARAS